MLLLGGRRRRLFCPLFLCWGGSCRSGGCSRRCSISAFADFIGVEFLDRNIFNFGDGIDSVLHRLGIIGARHNNIKAELELLLLEILRRRDALDDIADLIEGMHDHNRACCLENAGFHQCNLDMVEMHAGFFCLFHDIEIDLVKAEINLCSTAAPGRCGGRGCCCGRRRGPLGDRAELCNEIRNVDDILRLAVSDAVYHLLQRVEAFEQRIHNVFIEFELFFADEVQNILHLMRQLRNLGKSHRRGHALERVRVAEDVVDGADLLHVLLEAEQAFIQRLKMLM